jgi:hypothetical protein
MAGLVSGTLLWSRIIYSLTVLLLFLAVILAYKGGPFWYAFSAVGWGYFLIGVGPWFNQFCNADAPIAFFSINQYILSSYYINRLCDLMVPYVSPGDPQFANRAQVHSFRVAYTTGIAHSMLTFLFALFGGVIAEMVSSMRNRVNDTPI